MEDYEFQQWMRAVDRSVQRTAGVSVHDLEDCLFRDWHEDGMDPGEAADLALENAGWDE